MHDLAGDIFKSKLFDTIGDGRENLPQVRCFGWDSPSDQIDKINELECFANYFGEAIIYWKICC